MSNHSGHHDHPTTPSQSAHDPAKHAGHEMPAPAEHDMTAHAGHEASPAAAGHDEHAGHAMSSAASGHDEHAGHGVMHEGHADLMKRRFWVTLPLTLIVVIFSPMIQQWFGYQITFPGSEWVAPVLGTFIYFYGGMPFLSMARQELRIRQPGMMTLVSVAITTAWVYSMAIVLFPPSSMAMEGAPPDYFWELATLITIMLLGHWIELRSVGQAQGALRELARLLPDTAERLLPSGETESVPVSQLVFGDRVLIRPGASVPADGVILSGDSSLNESMITGESRPVDKTAGDRVIGGTINGAGSLRVELDKVGAETALAGIMRLVDDAQKSQSRAQTLAQRAAFYLTLIALGAAALTLVGWLVITGNSAEAIRSMVTVLVIACPHALGLAVPLVVSISTTLSARNGLLVRKRTALESAKDLNVIIFDKTGTLTKGELGVVAVAVDGVSEQDAVRIAAGVEGDSEHPIARAILGYAAAQGFTPAAVAQFESLPGRGVRAVVDGQTWQAGGPRLLEQASLTLPAALNAAKDRAEADGQSVIVLATETAVVALFAIADVIRPESKPAVDQLHELGVKVALLTGDSEPVAKAVARQLGIDTVFAQVLPEDKASKVRELQRGGQKVAMVGDGVNDAPALLTADVGIAIGAGTDVAIESAGIILVRSNPLDIVKVIRLSHATYRKMIQNLAWATGYNVVAIPLAMGVLAPWGITLDPAIGAIFMSLSTVIVALNAQLLRRLDLNAA